MLINVKSCYPYIDLQDWYVCRLIDLFEVIAVSFEIITSNKKNLSLTHWW